MNILALDLGSKTGWAVRMSSGEVVSGVQEFKVARGSSVGVRFIAFRHWFTAVLGTFRIEYVAYEQAHLRGGAATDLLVGFTTRVQEICEEMGQIPFLAVHSATLKLFSTGSGRAEKDAMMAAAKAKYPGIEPQDDNEADALLLLEYVRAQLEDPLVITVAKKKRGKK